MENKTITIEEMLGTIAAAADHHMIELGDNFASKKLFVWRVLQFTSGTNKFVFPEGNDLVPIIPNFEKELEDNVRLFPDSTEAMQILLINYTPTVLNLEKKYGAIMAAALIKFAYLTYK